MRTSRLSWGRFSARCGLALICCFGSADPSTACRLDPVVVAGTEPASATGIQPGAASDFKIPVLTLEDIYGETGNSFQGAIGFLNFQAEATFELPETGYGIAIDDMVVEWREFRLMEDTTSCVTGQCAVLDLGTTGMFEGSALVDVTLVEPSPYGTRCAADGICTISGAACSAAGPCAPDEGDCESLVCFTGADCPTTSCVGSTNDCDGSGWYFDNGDDNDCDNDGTLDISVRATSATEVAGERISLNHVSGDIYRGQAAISAKYDLPGVLLVQAQGATSDAVTVRYDDIDDGTGASVCLNSVDPAAQGEVTASTTVSVIAGTVLVAGYTLTDNGDNDGQADDDETVSMRIELVNGSGVALTGVRARLSSNDPDIDCILNTVVDFGDLAIGELRSASEEFRFVVGQVGRVDVLERLTGDFIVSISADQFDNTLTPQTIALDLDLDFVGGSGPTSFAEGFESGSFGSFTTMHLDAGLGSLAASDGYRCQYSDPDWVNSNSFGFILDCFVNPTAAPDVYYWRIQNDRAFSGTQSLYFGIPLADPLGFTTPFGRLQAVRTTNPVNLGWDRVCSETRTSNCLTEANCPAGEECVSATPKLFFKHQISTLDSRSVNVTSGETGARGVVQAQLADELGNEIGNWIQLTPLQNIYDQQGTDNFSNCMFDPIDDGNDEDDFFDPTDPNRRLGPSSTCFPTFSFTYLGDTDDPFSEQNIGNASDGPGLQGVGVGTWVESMVPLQSFRGRRVRLRFLDSSLKLGGTTDVETAFGFNPDPTDDGWWIDDVKVTDTLNSPATVVVDAKDNSGLPNCGLACSVVNASLVAQPATLGAPGQVVRLNASASTSDQCIGGVLQYRFWTDGDGNGLGGDPADTLRRNWTDNPKLVDAPSANSSYIVDVRCATLPTCADTAALPVQVNCPASGNLGGLFQRVTASASALQWANPVDGSFAKGLLSAVDSYDTSGGGTGSFSAANSFSISGDNPIAGEGIWYLFKSSASGGTFCNELATWTSGGVGEDVAPGRDSSLP